MLDTVITWGALAASIGATVYAVFYDWHGGIQHKRQQQQQQSTALLGPDDNFSWAVMGVVSFIPLFNYLVSSWSGSTHMGMHAQAPTTGAHETAWKSVLWTRSLLASMYGCMLIGKLLDVMHACKLVSKGLAPCMAEL